MNEQNFLIAGFHYISPSGFFSSLYRS